MRAVSQPARQKHADRHDSAVLNVSTLRKRESSVKRENKETALARPVHPFRHRRRLTPARHLVLRIAGQCYFTAR